MIVFSIDIVKLIGNTFVEYCQNCQKPFPKLETTHFEFGKIFSRKIWHVEVLVTCRVLAAATREMCMRSSAKRNVVHDATRSSLAVAGAWIAPRLACLLAFCNYQSCPGAWPCISSSPHMRRHDHCAMHTSRSSVLKSFFFSPLLVSLRKSDQSP